MSALLEIGHLAAIDLLHKRTTGLEFLHLPSDFSYFSSLTVMFVRTYTLYHTVISVIGG